MSMTQSLLKNKHSSMVDCLNLRSFVSFLERRYGKFSLDAFANDYNCKCDRFCSLYHVPGSSGIDAFNFDWSNEFLLLVPPVSIIGRVLQHLLLCQAEGVLVVPCWPSAYYWPLLIKTRCRRRGQNRGSEGAKMKVLYPVKTPVVYGKMVY